MWVVLVNSELKKLSLKSLVKIPTPIIQCVCVSMCKSVSISVYGCVCVCEYVLV